MSLKISLKAARVNANLNIKEAAEIAKVTPRTMQSYEKGTTAIPIDKLRPLLKAYEVGIENLKFF